ncbi:hypothetical protein FDK21_03415 [Cohaesibacter sp. CAU 1516]|uniref:hypothetical protein n=1 Tax=Cohaesibacter sp. CAU 1516 TaxID=2576038 RepID=UPI0010FD3211|nr:hypothetical protein [Cohaesibacter sp. CAU 1516]TLP48722.1 hypothetical protein FDK21_03415 [Cohaesibacter sp. CAU 1516]
MHKIELHIIGSLPPPRSVAFALWGKDCVFDSFGDASHPDDTNWRELMLCLRRPNPETGFYHSDESTRIDITPSKSDRDRVILSSLSLELIDKICVFLKDQKAISRKA